MPPSRHRGKNQGLRGSLPKSKPLKTTRQPSTQRKRPCGWHSRAPLGFRPGTPPIPAMHPCDSRHAPLRFPPLPRTSHQVSGTACAQDGDELHLIGPENLLTRCMQVLESGQEEVEPSKNSSTPELGLPAHLNSPRWRLTVLSSCFSNSVGLRFSSVLGHQRL